MRILCISPRFEESAGGDGLYAYHLAHASAACDVETHVLTIRDGAFVHVELSGSSREIHTSPSGTGQRLGEARKGIVRRNYFSRTAGRYVAKTLDLVRPDIVHVHGMHQYFTLAAVVALRNAEVPALLTVHDYKLLCGNASFFSDHKSAPCFRCLAGAFLPPLVERCKQNSWIASAGASVQMGLWALSHGLDVFSAFHCGSEYVRALLAPNSVVGRRVIKLRMPMLNHPQMHRRLADDIPRIAYVGRFVSHKGPLVFAQAVRGLGANVVLYGDGPLRPKTAAILATDPTVTFRGWVSHDVMDAELGPGVIVVVPYQAHETFCYVVLEAMARGCCVVASARGAIPELIQDGVNGVLVQDPTATEFRKALADLLRDPARVFSMGERAVTIAGEVPSLGQHTGEMLALYDTLIRRRPI